MIIGLAGKAFAGKDTVGRHLVEEYGFERRAFADKLKEAAAALLDIPLWEVNKHKVDSSVHVAVGYQNEPEQKFEGQPSKMWSPIVEPITFRHFLQRIGTEMGREVFGYNFWVDMCLPDDHYEIRNIVVTDVRFPNEVERIHDLEGKIIRIDRPNQASAGIHVSEDIERLDVDMIMQNDGTLEKLYKATDEIMEVWGYGRTDS